MIRPRKIVGIPWFTLDSYGACRFQMTDKETLPLDFSEWQASADEQIQTIEEDGHDVLKVRIDPARFPVWCRERGLARDARARQRFANYYAFRAAIG